MTDLREINEPNDNISKNKLSFQIKNEKCRREIRGRENGSNMLQLMNNYHRNPKRDSSVPREGQEPRVVPKTGLTRTERRFYNNCFDTQ